MKNLLLVVAGLIASFSVQANTTDFTTFSFKNESSDRKVMYVTVKIKKEYDHCSDSLPVLKDFKTYNTTTRELNRERNGDMVIDTQQSLSVVPDFDIVYRPRAIQIDPVTGLEIPRVCTADIKYLTKEETIEFSIISGATININTYDGVEFVGLSFKK